MGTVLLLLLALGVWWWWWRLKHPATLHGCPRCPERVRDVPDHLLAAHGDDLDYFCVPCQRTTPNIVTHWRLWHEPREVGPEDLPGWPPRVQGPEV